jgi:uncharacterized membrane protein
MLNYNTRARTDDHNPAAALTWSALGAGLMYLFDPNLGRRRRHVLRDKLVHYARKTRDCCDATFRDVYHRTVGLAYETRASFSHEEVADEVLVERVRSKLGRVVSHPHSVQVCAAEGVVYLAGTVLQDEAENLLSTVKSIRGVRDLAFSLDVRPEPGNVPELQGGTPRPGARSEFMQENWSPAARLLSGVAGATAGLYGVSRGGLLGTVTGLLGMGMLVRAATNIETKKLVGATQSRRGIDVQKVINIDAPVEEVWSFWSNYDNFPLWMRNVKQVSQNPETGLSRWVVAGPVGIPFQWDAAETERVENEVLAWKSVPGSTVANTGVVRFHRNDGGTTRVDVKLSYNPPAGAIGHALAALFGSDPKTEIDEDLARMKTLIETANFPRDASRHLEEEQPAGSASTT